MSRVCRRGVVVLMSDASVQEYLGPLLAAQDGRGNLALLLGDGTPRTTIEAGDWLKAWEFSSVHDASGTVKIDPESGGGEKPLLYFVAQGGDIRDASSGPTGGIGYVLDGDPE